MASSSLSIPLAKHQTVEEILNEDEDDLDVFVAYADTGGIDDVDLEDLLNDDEEDDNIDCEPTVAVKVAAGQLPVGASAATAAPSASNGHFGYNYNNANGAPLTEAAREKAVGKQISHRHDAATSEKAYSYGKSALPVPAPLPVPVPVPVGVLSATAADVDIDALAEAMSQGGGSDDEFAIESWRSFDIDNALGDRHDESDLGLSAIDMSELQELRYLQLGNRDIVTLLRTKRKRAVGSEESSVDNIQFEKLPIISSQLKRNADYKQHGPGIATCLHSNAKFVAIGTSRGYVLVFDYNQEIRQVLGAQGGAPASNAGGKAAISALDASTNGSVLLMGSANGEICLWDVLKGTVLKKVGGLHEHSIIRIGFIGSISDGMKGIGSLSSDSGYPSEMSTISVDSKGVVHRIKFSKQLWSSFSTESDCLLDGNAGVVLDMKALQPLPQSLRRPGVEVFTSFPSANKYAAFCTQKKTYIIQVSPTIRVIFRWSGPSHLPAEVDSVISIDWGWTSVATAAGKRRCDFVLYRAWGDQLEALEISFEPVKGKEADAMESYGFKVIHERRLQTHSIVSIRVISEQQISVLTQSEIFVMNTSFEILERNTLLPDIVNLAAFFVHKSTMQQCTPNIIAGFDQSLYVLESEGLYRCHMQLWDEKIDDYIAQGKWLECLSLLLENYEALQKSSDRGDNDLFAFYLKKYVQLAVSNPVAKATLTASSNHFHLVAGVCLEICIAVDRTDLLFGDIYNSFVLSYQQHAFLDCLEPCVLNRYITYLPPVIVADLFEFAVKFHRMATVERCFAYLDVTQIDLHVVTKFLIEHEMYSTYLYVHSYGLFDFAGSFQQVFERMILLHDRCLSATASGHFACNPGSNQVAMAYKLLLFLKYSSENLIFPRKEATSIPSNWIYNLVDLISEREYCPVEHSSHAQAKLFQSSSYTLLQTLPFPYMFVLSSIDMYALIFYLCRAIKRVQDTSAMTEQSPNVSKLYENIFLFCQSSASQMGADHQEARRVFFQCAFMQLSECKMPLALTLLIELVNYITEHVKSHFEAEEIALVIAQNQAKHHQTQQISSLRDHLEVGGYWRAALQFADARNYGRTRVVFDKALKCYSFLNYHNARESRTQIFQYIDAEYKFFSEVGSPQQLIEYFNLSVVSMMAAITDIDINQAKAISCKYFLPYFSRIVDALKGTPARQYEICEAMIDHVLSDKTVVLADIYQPQDILQYIHLMLKFRPSSVYTFVSSHDHFPLDECIQLCRQFDAIDACAVLMEKTGEVSTALDLLLDELISRLLKSKVFVDTQLRSEVKSTLIKQQESTDRPHMLQILSSNGYSRSDAAMKLSFYSSLQHIVYCICSLCVRHSSRANAVLWFKAFDAVLVERNKYNQGALSSTGEIMCVVISTLTQQLVSSMKDIVSSHEIVKRVTHSYSGSKYIEFKDVILSMLLSYRCDFWALTATIHIHNTDLYQYQQETYKNHRKADRHDATPLEEVHPGDYFGTSDNASTQSSPMIRLHSRTNESRIPNLRSTLPPSIRLSSAPPSSSFMLTGPYDGETRKPGSLPRQADFVASKI